MKVGVFALQGDFSKHKESLLSLSTKILEVRTAHELDAVDALIIPGGESSTFLKLLTSNFKSLLIKRAKEGMPILATCAGLILIAKKVHNPEQESLGLLNVEVERNAYGRQLDSFIEPKLQLSDIGYKELEKKEIKFKRNFEAVFIRAPEIIKVNKEVKVLATHKNNPVLVMENNIIAASFHPELSNEKDDSIYKLFLSNI